MFVVRYVLPAVLILAGFVLLAVGSSSNRWRRVRDVRRRRPGRAAAQRLHPHRRQGRPGARPRRGRARVPRRARSLAGPGAAGPAEALAPPRGPESPHRLPVRRRSHPGQRVRVRRAPAPRSRQRRPAARCAADAGRRHAGRRRARRLRGRDRRVRGRRRSLGSCRPRTPATSSSHVRRARARGRRRRAPGRGGPLRPPDRGAVQPRGPRGDAPPRGRGAAAAGPGAGRRPGRPRRPPRGRAVALRAARALPRRPGSHGPAARRDAGQQPALGEHVKAHAIVLAELGLCAYGGKVVRDPRALEGEWSRERRAEHVIGRLAFAQELWSRLGPPALPRRRHRGAAAAGAPALVRVGDFRAGGGGGALRRRPAHRGRRDAGARRSRPHACS